jgi:hypothetical protein
MVTDAPKRPLVFANLFLDSGDLNYSGKTISFRGIDYSRRIITEGSIDRSISLPSGPLRITDASLSLEDVDGEVKEILDAITPLRRLASISPDLEFNADEVDSIVPIYTGEIIDFSAPKVGEVNIRVRDVCAVWLNQPIPHLITRANFPNLPDDINSAFASIVLGRVYSYDQAHIEKQGALPCPLVDTTTNDYCVARHECYAVTAVYRKNHLDQRFVLVDSGEYTTPLVTKVIGGVTYHFQMIRFAAQQYDGTLIQCDASGVNSTIDFDDSSTNYPVEVRNPADCLASLIYFCLLDTVDIIQYDPDSFSETRARCIDRSYVCDGAVTGKANSLEVITNGKAIGDLCSSFNIDFYQLTTGVLAIKLFDLTIDAPLAIPVDADRILKKTIVSTSPKDIKNHIRYRYHKAYTELPDTVITKGNRDWGYEYNITNVHDQTELADTGANPNLEKLVELHFVRDHPTAVDVIKKKLPYFSLRSYDVKLDVSAYSGGGLFSGFNYNLTQACLISSTNGFGTAGTGFDSALARIYGVDIDLSRWSITLSLIVYFPISDGDLDIEYTSLPSHDAQTRKPQFPVTVNGTTPVTAQKSMDLRDDLTIPAGMIPVHWTEDLSDPFQRKVTGFVVEGGSTDIETVYECILTSQIFSFGSTEAPVSGACVPEVAAAIQVIFEDIEDCTHGDGSLVYGGVFYTVVDGCLQSVFDVTYSAIAAIDECTHVSGTYGIGEITCTLSDACLQAFADCIQTTLDALDSRDDTLQANIDTLEGEIETVASDLSTFEGSVSTEFASLESAISSLTSFVSAIGSQVDVNTGNIATLIAAVNELYSCLAEVEVFC